MLHVKQIEQETRRYREDNDERGLREIKRERNSNTVERLFHTVCTVSRKSILVHPRLTLSHEKSGGSFRHSYGNEISETLKDLKAGPLLTRDTTKNLNFIPSFFSILFSIL